MNAPVFLVLRGGAIGDFICTLPALAALRARWPRCRIHLVAYAHVGGLARVCGTVDTAASLDRSEVAGLFADRAEITAFQRQLASSCDVAISYLYDPSGAVCRNLRRAGAGRVLYGSPIVGEGHAIDWLMRPLEDLGIRASGNASAWLRVPAAVIDGAARRLPAGARNGRFTIIHPGSGSASKNWPAAGFADLAGRIARQGTSQALFLVGEADREAARTLAREAPGVPLIKPADLIELAGVLAAGTVYIGNDSGVTHLAAAIGLPVLALFGPSDPARWAPRNPSVRIIRAPAGGLEALAPSTVWETWRELSAVT